MSWLHRQTRLAIPAVFALAMTVPGMAPAFASPSPGLLAVSSTTADPFADCAADFPDLQPGTNYPNSELEPTIAVNPVDSTNLVAAWQQDRWSDAASRGNVVAISHDGGVTWATVTSTKTSFCTGGTPDNGGAMFRASNPWVTMGPDGTAYLISLGIPFFNQSAILVSRSTDGGTTWSDPTILDLETDNAMNDKPTITADPYSANVYAVWTRNEFPTEQAVPKAADQTGASRGPVWFARTIDGGATWQPAHQIFDPGEQNGTLGHQIVVLPRNSQFSNELVDVFELEYGKTNEFGVRGVHIAVIRSQDHGATWSDVNLIADALPAPVVDPVTGISIRTGAHIPDIAVDRNTGALYAVWQDARFSHGAYNDIALSMSVDGGLAWTAPTKVNVTPSAANPWNRQAFNPSVQVSADGTLAVSYYDLRNDGPDTSANQPLETDRFLARCSRPAAVPGGCATGWTETRLTPDSFDLRAAPNSLGLFLGDSQGLTSVGDTFVSLFTMANDAQDPGTVYFTTTP